METQVLDEVHSYVKMIVATGGGTVKEKRVSHNYRVTIIHHLAVRQKHVLCTTLTR
jgi:shikimate kinase